VYAPSLTTVMDRFRVAAQLADFPDVSQSSAQAVAWYTPKQCLKVETQNAPVGFASLLLHLRFVVAFHGARYLREHAKPWARHRPSGRPRQP